ncbi:MAG: hypothetical protein CMK59_14300 [Proteobacteria bacterium]|nr:hypothetical protein [Pseudomonadota bacterium]
MTPYVYEICTRIHGHVAVLGLAVLLHPIISMHKQKRLRKGTRWSLWLSVFFVLGAYMMGLWIYPDYRTTVKPRLISHNIAIAYLFESKEHLAFCSVLAVCLGGFLALKTNRERDLKLARILLFWGWFCGVIVAVLGIIVAAA